MAEKKMCEKKSKAMCEMPKKGGAKKEVMMTKGAGMQMAAKLGKKAKKG